MCQHLRPPTFPQGANSGEVKLPPLTKSNHSVGPLRGTPAETLSFWFGEFIYPWQAHILSHALILCSCQKSVQYTFPPTEILRQRVTRQWGRDKVSVCSWSVWGVLNTRRACSFPHTQTQSTCESVLSYHVSPDEDRIRVREQSLCRLSDTSAAIVFVRGNEPWGFQATFVLRTESKTTALVNNWLISNMFGINIHPWTLLHLFTIRQHFFHSGVSDQLLPVASRSIFWSILCRKRLIKH